MKSFKVFKAELMPTMNHKLSGRNDFLIEKLKHTTTATIAGTNNTCVWPGFVKGIWQFCTCSRTAGLTGVCIANHHKSAIFVLAYLSVGMLGEVHVLSGCSEQHSFGSLTFTEHDAAKAGCYCRRFFKVNPHSATQWSPSWDHSSPA